MRFIHFPKIGQFKDAIHSIRQRGAYVGRDVNGDIIYDSSILMPKITFIGSVKMHGTNSAVSFHRMEGVRQAQSRNKILSIESDNNGFCRFTESIPEDVWDFLFNSLLSPLITEPYLFGRVTVFGEWIGPGVQGGEIGIKYLPNKIFVVFGVYVGERDELEDKTPTGYFVPLCDIPSFNDESYHLNDNRIYLITDLAPTFKIEVDCNYPEISRNKLVELTMQVEAKCPVANYFGIEGTGEGIVWCSITEGWMGPDFWFKTKGEKHSASKIKKIAEVDVTKVEGVIAFLEETLTEVRLNQALEYLKEKEMPIDRSSTGEFVRWMINDVTTEEAIMMEASGLTVKEVGPKLGTAARQWFFNQLNK